MRVITVLLLLSGCLAAQPKLTSQDESEIRAAIEERAKDQNLKGSGDVWSERTPQVYRVKTMEAISPDVATADADGTRTGSYFPGLQYVFILRRMNGRWIIARQLKVYSGPAPVRIHPVETAPPTPK